HTDAAVDIKTKKAGIGFVVIGKDVYEQLSFPLGGLWDNHTAEWKAVNSALNWLLEQQYIDEMLFIYTDSK
ncbi:RNase H family protein, partial [Salmonella enterica]|uniref:RNase H family protein n=1 Tax=Salmonella enterica TaxID=28901 RepID=UPI000CCA9F98